MLRLLAVRDARLLLAGETFSMFGDRAMFLVLGIWAKTLTQSNAAAGLAPPPRRRRLRRGRERVRLGPVCAPDGDASRRAAGRGQRHPPALRTREATPARHARRFRAELVAGLGHIRRTLPLGQIVVATGVALLVVGFAETLIFAVVAEGLHRPPSFIGVLSALQGVGAIAGGLTAARLLRRLGDGRLVGAGLAGFASGTALLVAPTLPLVLFGMGVAGVGISWAVVAFRTTIQQRTPEHLQGRVYSTAVTVVGVSQTMSIALGAGLSTLVDYRLLLVVMAAVTVTCALYLLSRHTFAVPVDRVPVRAEPA
jgi:hypothetical protein